jgi:anti-sigma regulatory factor (Ser/Thr protein kinase)
VEVGAQLLSGLLPHRVHRITEASQTGSLRRELAELTRSLGVSEETAGRVAIVATECGTNLVKHTHGGGEVLFRQIALDGLAGVELLGIDRGPGMDRPDRMLEDGVSTAGSPGTGLGAIRRLSDEFALYSAPGVGTAVLSRIYNRLSFDRLRPAAFEWGGVSLSKPGEDVCGDGWGMALSRDRALVLVADGLGHGPGASAASQEAVRAFFERADLGPEALVHKLHARLRPTRGAAVAIAAIRPEARTLDYVGVGNIFGRILRPGEKTLNLVSMNGTLGYGLVKVQPFRYPWAGNPTLVMNSDGLLSNWDIDAYPGLEGRHPALVAAMAYRDNNRGTDDLTIVGLRPARR